MGRTARPPPEVEAPRRVGPGEQELEAERAPVAEPQQAEAQVAAEWRAPRAPGGGPEVREVLAAIHRAMAASLCHASINRQICCARPWALSLASFFLPDSVSESYGCSNFVLASRSGVAEGGGSLGVQSLRGFDSQERLRCLLTVRRLKAK